MGSTYNVLSHECATCWWPVMPKYEMGADFVIKGVVIRMNYNNYKIGRTDPESVCRSGPRPVHSWLPVGTGL